MSDSVASQQKLIGVRKEKREEISRKFIELTNK